MSNYKKGERIQVRDFPNGGWTSRLFDEYTEDGKVYCVNDVHEIRFENGGDYNVTKWDFHRKMETKPNYKEGETLLVKEDGEWIEKVFYSNTPDDSGDIWVVSHITRYKNHKRKD